MTEDLPHNHLDIGMKPPGDCPACDQVRLGFGPSRFRRAMTNDYPPDPVKWVDWLILAVLVTGFAIVVGVMLTGPR